MSSTVPQAKHTFCFCPVTVQVAAAAVSHSDFVCGQLPGTAPAFFVVVTDEDPDAAEVLVAAPAETVTLPFELNF